MPTPESEAAFARLMDARTVLNDISSELNIASHSRPTTRYQQLQAQWEEAFEVFKKATVEFYDIVQRIDRKQKHPYSENSN